MAQENRKEARVSTHIMTEILMEGSLFKSCGYIENLSKDGIGIVSLDSFQPGDTVISSFFLSQLPGNLSPKVTLVHQAKGECHLNYYGFKFDTLTDSERKAIDRYILENNLLSQPA